MIIEEGVMLRGGVTFSSETCFVRFPLMPSPNWKGPPEVIHPFFMWPGSDPWCGPVLLIQTLKPGPLLSLFFAPL